MDAPRAEPKPAPNPPKGSDMPQKKLKHKRKAGEVDESADFPRAGECDVNGLRAAAQPSAFENPDPQTTTHDAETVDTPHHNVEPHVAPPEAEAEFVSESSPLEEPPEAEEQIKEECRRTEKAKENRRKSS